jgi:hypothetical protein
MNGRRRAIGPRDQHATTFSAALLRLCDAAGAIGAALVDAEGETVDYAGGIDPFDIKVAAAEWAVVFARLRASRSTTLAATDTLRVRARRKSFVIKAVFVDYVLIVQLLPHAFSISHRAVNEAIRELSVEAGLAMRPLLDRSEGKWCRVDVRCDPGKARRPNAVWVRGTWLGVEVLGRWTRDLGSREVGYRARLASGVELTLVRERLGRWYAEVDGPL